MVLHNFNSKAMVGITMTRIYYDVLLGAGYTFYRIIGSINPHRWYYNVLKH